MFSPVVLGSVKSGAGSPTSAAVTMPAPPSRLTSSIPNHHRCIVRFGSLGMWFPPFSRPPCLTTPRPPRPAALPGDPVRSADEPIGLIQQLWRNGEPQGVRHLQIQRELDLRVHLH